MTRKSGSATPIGLPINVQLIKRKSSEQWFINFPSAVAQTMDFSGVGPAIARHTGLKVVQPE